MHAPRSNKSGIFQPLGGIRKLFTSLEIRIKEVYHSKARSILHYSLTTIIKIKKGHVKTHLDFFT